jgi:hypothetical protein
LVALRRAVFIRGCMDFVRVSVVKDERRATVVNDPG